MAHDELTRENQGQGVGQGQFAVQFTKSLPTFPQGRKTIISKSVFVHVNADRLESQPA